MSGRILRVIILVQTFLRTLSKPIGQKFSIIAGFSVFFCIRMRRTPSTGQVWWPPSRTPGDAQRFPAGYLQGLLEGADTSSPIHLGTRPLR
jgi:hypothetical protein